MHDESMIDRRLRTAPGKWRLPGLLARVWIVVGVLLLTMTALVPETRAVEVEFAGRPVKREILALFDGRHEKSSHLTRIHRFAEMPLNWMGYKLVYRDTQQPLPDIAELERYRGILTWFLEPMRNSESVVRWLDQATQSPLRYVVIGEIAPSAQQASLAAIERIARRLGLDFKGQNNDLGFDAKVVYKNEAMIGFERPLDKVLTSYPVLRAQAGVATTHLTLQASRAGVAMLSDVITTSAKGALAVYDFAVFYEFTTDRARWIVNPFSFFKLAFGADRFPIPDVTTLAGRRIYFSQIDGDGWNNLSEIESFRARSATAAEVIAQEAIEPYPDLPVSVGLIAGDAIAGLGGTLSSRRVSRRLFALPQVEVASHTYTHPFNWSFFETYDRAEEERQIEKFTRPQLPLRERLRSVITELAGVTRDATPSNDKYIAGTSDLPRTYLKAPFDIDLEVRGALSVSESFAPPGKRAKLYLWSGDTTPFEGAIRATRAAGVRNMNGGDSRFDQEYPSVVYLPPVGRERGTERQIYSGNSNENTYTNDWLGPYFGFFMLDQTLDNTEQPRRLKPFNLYYHMYSGEKPAALASIKHFLDRARSSPLIPIAASDYAAIADGFYDVEIEQVDVASWSVAKRGALSTVRFDDAADVSPDYAASIGVLGSTRHQGSLYVALDPTVERAVVTLRTGPQVEPDRKQVAALVEARWQVYQRRELPCGFTTLVQGFGRGDMLWTSEPGRTFDITLERNGVPALTERATADAAGVISLALVADAREPLAMRFTCRG